MRIIAPVNTVEEVGPILDAGADEIYCGVLPPIWSDRYSHVAAVNRSERVRSSLKDYTELRRVVSRAHARGVEVRLTLNGLYTSAQYPLVEEQIERSEDAGVDALIVADVGLLLRLRELDVGLAVHVSTGGTTFNSRTARFFRDLGASRIILPRHMRLGEIARALRGFEGVESEVFILNGGCRHVTGLCTFQHGLEEARHFEAWGLAEKLNLGYRTLGVMRRMPRSAVNALDERAGLFGVIAPCMSNFEVISDIEEGPDDLAERLGKRTRSDHFDLFYQIDTCGACALPDFAELGVDAIKIVGRGHETRKKVKDVAFLRRAREHLQQERPSREDYIHWVRHLYRRIYRVGCRDLCYFDVRDREGL